MNLTTDPSYKEGHPWWPYAHLMGRKFIRNATHMRNHALNGIYTLRIEPPLIQSSNAPGSTRWWQEHFGDVPFSLVLKQQRHSGAKAPDIVFPPDPTRCREEDLLNNSDIIEVTAVDDVLRAALNTDARPDYLTNWFLRSVDIY